MSSEQLTLHIWPGRWELPSIEPACLAAVLYLQLAIPGKYKLSPSVDPDRSPSGQLPYITHAHRAVALPGPIGKYVASMRETDTADLDASLSAAEKAQRVAWVAHVEGNMGDLVAHMLFSLCENWIHTTHSAYASVLPIPQRYYVPNRIRTAVRPRLQAGGLWDLPGIEQKEEEANSENKSPFRDGRVQTKEVVDPKAKFAEVFEREKVLEKARATFDLYVRLLGTKSFFYQNRPTTLDISLASHTLILIKAPFVDTLIQTLLLEKYPVLVQHAHRVESLAFADTPLPEPTPPPPYSLGTLIPWPRRRGTGAPPVGGETHVPVEDAQFVALRWAWIAAAVVGTVGYLVSSGISIKFVDRAQLNQEEERKETME